ncbi:hypothetical protein LCGC14_0850050 [marine sediment metagenome]|uniref:Uncharacterized protein n=1 Tax=marine sediment metagenome TaxID=412755 RepID=A0A0F9PAN1_9ZZZZ
MPFLISPPHLVQSQSPTQSGATRTAVTIAGPHVGNTHDTKQRLALLCFRLQSTSEAHHAPLGSGRSPGPSIQGDPLFVDL